ncbi:MAG: metallophosphoesterase [Mycobacterium sp.]|nr:metallophosphoesterase [Mycobacterium sp.]
MEKQLAGYDIIGDIHGCATKLKALLAELGYQLDGAGVYRHPERTAVFVGDLIDRGEEQLDVLELVKAMVDAGSAKIVMGNHEFNAIAWATASPATGEPLRKHNDSNYKQHKDFLEQLSEDRQAEFIAWFTTLPLWLDLGGVRVAHACWHQGSIDVVVAATEGSGRLSTVDNLVAATTRGTPLYDAVEILLKGPEISLVDHDMVAYFDHEAQKPREAARVRWWDHTAATLPDIAELRGAKLENRDPYPSYEPREVSPKYLDYVYTDEVPLFYGHYWRKWDHHRDEWTTYTACVDFSAVRGGTLVAYRWNGEAKVHWKNYVPHDPAVVAPMPSD